MLKITEVNPGSIGADLGLVPGDIILSINQQPVRDILDYYFHLAGEELSVRIKTAEGELWDFEIEKEYEEDLGLEFQIRARQCANECVFCFIDQQPPNLRSTLYIKDDDYRLSFLHGNYITLTNLKPQDFQRITGERISPLYISVHAADPEVRARMLGRPEPLDVIAAMKDLSNFGIHFHGQIVICPGYNDGTVFTESLEKLAGLGDSLLSLAVVPVGLTKHRQNLTPLKPVDKATAQAVIAQIDQHQNRFLKKLGRRVVFAADELFLLANLPLPSAEYYEDFTQLENGIGLIRRTLIEAEALTASAAVRAPEGKILLVTGKAAEQTMGIVAAKVKEIFPALEITVAAVENRFFGSQISVAGLLAGGDILDFLGQTELDYDCILVPEAAVRAGCFIDDYTLDQLAQILDKPVYTAGNVGEIVNIIGNEVF